MSTNAQEEVTQVAAIADSLPVAVYVAAAPDGAFVYANRAFDQIVGRPPRVESLATSRSDAVHTRDGAVYPHDELPFARALREKTDVKVDDIVIHRADGKKVCVRAFGRPIFKADGTVSHVVIAFTDIADEVESQARATVVERRLQHILEHAPLVLFAFDQNGVVTLSEGHGLEALGLRPRELVGRSLFEVYADAPLSIANVRRVLAGEKFTSVGRVGSVTLETTYQPVCGDGGESEGAIGISLDVTERVKIQTRLLQAERMASMGTLSATVAHEINNPLTYVLGNLDFVAARLSNPSTPGSEMRDLLQRVNQAREGADRVRRIVRGLQTFARPDDDRAEAIDVHVAIEKSIEMADNAVRHRARVVRAFSRVPSVLANELRLSQVFVNLLLNAAQSIPEGHAGTNEIRVATSHEESEGVVTISITDTGAGIAADVKPRIFEPFFTTKPVGSGTGLGLSVCHGIVVGFGGSIQVESVVGQGSTFSVRLPASNRARKVTAIAPEATVPIRRGRLLIVDDDVNVARSFALRLDAEHHVEVSLAPRAVAERILGGERFDIVFCDLMMPEMTGMEFYALVAKGAPEQAARIVFVTGGAFTHNARQFVAGVPNTFLEKPFERRALDAVLARFLGK